MSDSVFVGGSPNGPQSLLLNRANRHGLIAGATGTGKTITLQILAQAFSEAGVPVFAADIKGDLSGLAAPGADTHKLHDKLHERARSIGLDPYDYAAAPTVFWDLLGEKGHPIRTTVSEMGPLLLSRLLDLNETQEGVLTVAFALADDQKLLVLDLKDLRALLTYVAENRAEISAEYGQVSTASVGAIQRRLLVLERAGADRFFGEPALSLADLIRTDLSGRGYVNVLDATGLIAEPRLYSTFLLWLLSELFEELPEVGDPEKPRMVFFFDEAHLLFEDAPRALLDKIEQVAKLIRSKGVGIYFVTQNPRDVPDDVLAQLGTRIQHALRAYTPAERKAVKAAAQSFRPNPELDSEAVITELGVGEALVSTLDAKGRPTVVERTLIRPPSSQIGPITDEERSRIIAGSPAAGRYDTPQDRESAYEILAERAEQKLAAAEKAGKDKAKASTSRRSSSRKSSGRQSYFEASMKSFLRTASTELSRQVIRGIMKNLAR
ncbi:helicase HerA-like domain-containing protein [Euryhalocaulis caribicus]|uniref:helicase HerA-like domain-containing protein n=1 Tax=Euryhalocaulis caribicus TaxID=1161401 RepID=UPI0003A88702|nr:helicase HerA-like domain-containing protein [Euryhalocaulis caribicus]